MGRRNILARTADGEFKHEPKNLDEFLEQYAQVAIEGNAPDSSWLDLSLINDWTNELYDVELNGTLLEVFQLTDRQYKEVVGKLGKMQENGELDDWAIEKHATEYYGSGVEDVLRWVDENK